MTDRPRLLPVETIPDGLLQSERYFWHVHQVMAFPVEEQRVIPPEVRAKIVEVFANHAGEVLEPLDAISGFFSHNFVFDNLNPAEREDLRDQMEANDPAGHAWYAAHMLRLNKITSLLLDVNKLTDFAQPILKRVLDSPPLAEQLDEIVKNARFRWKTVMRSLEDLTPAEHHALQRNMLEAHIAPLAQDVFDITVLSLNGWQPVPTTPDGKISRTMQEILDTRAATLRGASGQKLSGRAD